MSEQPEPTPQPDGERDWWDDPALPWRHQPSRADVICLAALGVVAVYALVMLPLRPVILGLAPHVLGSLGYRTGLIMTGALASVGDPWRPLVWVVGSLMVIKFHWVYWWAGRLWGRQILDVFAKDKGPRTRRRYDKAWEVTHRFDTIALIATFLPIPLPAGVIFAAVGAAGTSLRKFLTVCVLSSLTTSAAYLLLGYAIGEPAVQVMDAYGRYLWYVSIAIIVGMIAVALWRSRTKTAEPATGAAAGPGVGTVGDAAGEGR
nr:DedA family protein [Propionibacterium sp.]